MPFDIEQGFDDTPEVVLRVPIVLFFQERLSAGKTSQNENLHGLSMNRRKTLGRTGSVQVGGVYHGISKKQIGML
jgi:hypothetical protein